MLRKPDVHLQLAQPALGLYQHFQRYRLLLIQRVYHIPELPVPCVAAQQVAFFRGLQQYIHFHLQPGTFRFFHILCILSVSFEGSTTISKGRVPKDDTLWTN